MKKVLFTFLLIIWSTTIPGRFFDRVRHGTVFIVDEKILQNLLTNGQIR